ncbi:MAG: molybdopterin molybdenumtransferase MoeA, partial [Actinomycetota bacterium]|nr:molybdopterin molybdenumtransferase MoeA [Actinomycetota bacterium]
ALRPGGPTLLARLPDGRVVLGLAGNPLAAMIGITVVAAPMLEAMTGRSLSSPMTVRASQAIPGHARATSVLPYRDIDGSAIPSAWIGSAMMRGLADSSGFLLVPPSGVDAAGQADSLSLPWPPAR